MYSLFSGIVENDESYHIKCLSDEELFSIFSRGNYIQFDKNLNYESYQRKPLTLVIG